MNNKTSVWAFFFAYVKKMLYLCAGFYIFATRAHSKINIVLTKSKML